MWNINKEKELERKWGLVRQFLVLGAHQGLSRTWMHPTYFWFATNEHLRKYFALSYIFHQFPELIYLSFIFLWEECKDFSFHDEICFEKVAEFGWTFFLFWFCSDDDKRRWKELICWCKSPSVPSALDGNGNLQKNTEKYAPRLSTSPYT